MAFISKSGLNLALASIGIILFCSLALAQQSSSTTTETSSALHEHFSCQNATAAKVNASLLLGQWYEAARKTYPGADKDEHNMAQCVSVDFINKTSSLFINVTYSIDTTRLWKNQTKDYTLNVTLTDKEVDGVYNLTYEGNIKTYKILKTDNTDYAFICGYVVEQAPQPTTTTTTPPESSSTTVSSSSSSTTPTTTVSPSTSNSTATHNEAYIFLRNRPTNKTAFMNYVNNALAEYMDFYDLTEVIQSDKCVNGAATLVPMLTLMMAVVLALFKA